MVDGFGFIGLQGVGVEALGRNDAQQYGRFQIVLLQKQQDLGLGILWNSLDTEPKGRIYVISCSSSYTMSAAICWRQSFDSVFLS